MTEIAAWPDVHNALRIDYDAGAIERIRRHAGDQIAQRRTAAGLLLGERAGPRVAVLGAVPVDLTKEAITLARYRISVEGLPVVGWYIARANGELKLSAAEQSVFHELFPTEWQITLLLTPAARGALQVSFLYRDAGGNMVRSDRGVLFAERSDFPLPDPVPVPEPHPPEPPDPAPVRTGSGSRSAAALGWVLIALVALLGGAATYEYQHHEAIRIPIPRPTIIP